MPKPQRRTQQTDAYHDAPGHARQIRLNRFYLILAIFAVSLLAWSVAQPLPSQAHNLYQSEPAEPIDEPDLPGIDDLPDEILLDIPDAVVPSQLGNQLNDDVSGLGERLAVPNPATAWGDATSLNVTEMRARFEGLLQIEATGDFQFFYTPGADGGSFRILPVADSAPLVDGTDVDPAEETDTDVDTDSLYLDLAWRLGEDGLLPVPAGERLDVEVGARVYSPPTGVTLSVRERVDDEWQSSSISMEVLQWQTYRLARQISDDAQEVQIALRWQPHLESAWLEFQFPQLVTGWPEDAAESISPTDTPTPTPTSTPEAPPVPDEDTGEEALIEESAVEEAAEEIEEEAVEEEEVEEEAIEEEEELVVLDTPTPVLLVVTSTPTPQDVFEEATRVALATAWVPILGTSTPTPENMVTPTNTPTPFEIIITNTPVPENHATAVYQELLATAEAFTTGTPTPYPEEAAVLVATNTPTPEPRPTNTPTPLYVLLADLEFTPTPEPQPTVEFPAELMGKIMFLSTYGTSGGSANVLVMNPDGSELGIMGTRAFYNRARDRDAYSADRRFHVYVQREGVNQDGRWWQIKFDDHHYENSVANPVSFFDNGHSWAPVWSPTRQSVAFVSNDTQNDEIYLVNINEWPAMQLTDTDWEWNHHPSFSPDGSQIVFSSNRNTGVRQIWMMDASGGNQRQITNYPFASWNPVWVKYPDS